MRRIWTTRFWRRKEHLLLQRRYTYRTVHGMYGVLGVGTRGRHISGPTSIITYEDSAAPRIWLTGDS